MPPVLIEKEETESTQDDARAWLDANPTRGSESVWVRARQQTRGRGRQGRSWRAQGGDLMVSCGVRLSPVIRHRALITLIAGHALYSALKSVVPLPASAFLKWPNDLFWRDDQARLRKMAGILAESFGKDAVVVGWGVNLLGERFEEGVSQNYSAASLEEATGTALSAESCLHALQENFLKALQAWEAAPQTFESTVLEELRHGPMAPLWGMSGRLSQSGKRGVARGLSPQGALLVEVEGESEPRALLSGEFTFFV